MTPEPGSWLDPDPLWPPDGVWKTTAGANGLGLGSIAAARETLNEALRDGRTEVWVDGQRWTYTSLTYNPDHDSAEVHRRSPARRSVVIPLVLIAAVVAGLIVFVVTR